MNIERDMPPPADPAATAKAPIDRRGMAKWFVYVLGATFVFAVGVAVLQATLDTTKKGEPEATGQRSTPDAR